MASDRFTGADKALLEHVSRCGQPDIAVYDYALLIQHFRDTGMDEDDDAKEWVDFNIAGAWVGEGSPAILYRATPDEVREVLAPKADETRE